MRPAAPRVSGCNAAEIQAAIERFLKTSSKPAVLEPGEPLLEITRDSFSLEQRNTRLTLQAWDERRNLVRRITGVRDQSRGKLTLAVERFARREGELTLIDLARPAAQEWERRGSRLIFRERFRLFLGRQFSAWKVAELSAEPDLEHSLSASYPRALLRRGQSACAAIAAGPEIEDCSGMLSFGLIWLDYLRKREKRLVIEGLVLLCPSGRERGVSLRLPFLDIGTARFEVFTYSEEDFAGRLDPADYGNVSSSLSHCRRPSAPNTQPVLLSDLAAIPGFEQIEKTDGSWSLRVNGYEFARVTGDAIDCGLSRKRPASASEVHMLATELSRMRSESTLDRANGLYKQDPEAWLESRVRAEIETVDAGLRRFPVYGQVPAISAGERGVLDLLAVDHAGRLAVLELKASSDLHLPLQALDYWMRVKQHLEADEFNRFGYFPGVALRNESPRLLLIAPALEFHPTTETILSYFSRGISVERIGLNANWRSGLQIMFRSRNAERPDS